MAKEIEEKKEPQKAFCTYKDKTDGEERTDR